jgi:hypothetical protein
VASLAALERLLDYFPMRPIDDQTRLMLLRVGRWGLLNQRSEPDRTALQALATLRVTDAPLAGYLINYRCPIPAGRPPPPPECGWEVRHLAVLLTDVRDPDNERAIDDAFKDVTVPVRLEMYRRFAAIVKDTKSCARALQAFEDDSPAIRMEAIEMLSPECRERDAIVTRLKAMATDLGDPPDLPRLPFAARALVALTQFAPELIPILTKDVHASDKTWFGRWEYRAAVARAAGLTRDEPLARRFVDDPHTNVQYEALNSLAIMQSPER